MDYAVHETGMHSLSLLQGIFPMHGSNPGLPHGRGFTTSWVTREAHTEHYSIRRDFLGGSLKTHWKDWCWSWSSNTLATQSIDVKSQLIGKDPQAGKDWRQKEKRAAENKMVRQYHRLSGHEPEQTRGDGEEQGSLACRSPRGCRESDVT